LIGISAKISHVSGVFVNKSGDLLEYFLLMWSGNLRGLTMCACIFALQNFTKSQGQE